MTNTPIYGLFIKFCNDTKDKNHDEIEKYKSNLLNKIDTSEIIISINKYKYNNIGLHQNIYLTDIIVLCNINFTIIMYKYIYNLIISLIDYIKDQCCDCCDIVDDTETEEYIRNEIIKELQNEDLFLNQEQYENEIQERMTNKFEFYYKLFMKNKINKLYDISKINIDIIKELLKGKPIEIFNNVNKYIYDTLYNLFETLHNFQYIDYNNLNFDNQYIKNIYDDYIINNFKIINYNDYCYKLNYIEKYINYNKNLLSQVKIIIKYEKENNIKFTKIKPSDKLLIKYYMINELYLDAYNYFQLIEFINDKTSILNYIYCLYYLKDNDIFNKDHFFETIKLYKKYDIVYYYFFMYIYYKEIIINSDLENKYFKIFINFINFTKNYNITFPIFPVLYILENTNHFNMQNIEFDDSFDYYDNNLSILHLKKLANKLYLLGSVKYSLYIHYKIIKFSNDNESLDFISTYLYYENSLSGDLNIGFKIGHYNTIKVISKLVIDKTKNFSILTYNIQQDNDYLFNYIKSRKISNPYILSILKYLATIDNKYLSFFIEVLLITNNYKYEEDYISQYCIIDDYSAYYIANYYEKNNENDKALEYYNNLLKKDMVQCYLNIARILYKMKTDDHEIIQKMIQCFYNSILYIPFNLIENIKSQKYQFCILLLIKYIINDHNNYIKYNINHDDCYIINNKINNAKIFKDNNRMYHCLHNINNNQHNNECAVCYTSYDYVYHIPINYKNNCQHTICHECYISLPSNNNLPIDNDTNQPLCTYYCSQNKKHKT